MRGSRGAETMKRLALFTAAFLCATSAAAETLVFEFGPYELPSRRLMIMPDSRRALRLPKGRLINAVRMSTEDREGRKLEGEYICHDNLGPDYRGFNHGRKMLLDGYTREIRMPPGFAMAVERREFLTELMYNNPSERAISGVKTRFEIELASAAPASTALFPQMMSVFEQPAHVAPGHWGYYVRAKSKDTKTRLFDVLHDFSVHHISFHIHEHGRRILIEDLGSGRTLCDASPVYAGGKLAKMEQLSWPEGVTLRKGTVLRMSVDYDNPIDEAVDTMGAAILFGRCPKGKPGCDAIAQREAQNKDFDPDIYAAIVGGGAHAHQH